MLIDNVLIRPQGVSEVAISWESASETTRSYLFINGAFAVGPFIADARGRTVVLPVPNDKTFKIEVHDVEDDEEIPVAIEEVPLVKPVIAWNAVESAVCYKIYHTIFDTGSIESLLLQVPPMSMDRLEVDCPRKLEGKNGRWHYFRVETVDQFGNESASEIVPYHAADLPSVPDLMISRDTQSGLLTFRILQHS